MLRPMDERMSISRMFGGVDADTYSPAEYAANFAPVIEAAFRHGPIRIVNSHLEPHTHGVQLSIVCERSYNVRPSRLGTPLNEVLSHHGQQHDFDQFICETFKSVPRLTSIMLTDALGNTFTVRRGDVKERQEALAESETLDLSAFEDKRARPFVEAPRSSKSARGSVVEAEADDAEDNSPRHPTPQQWLDKIQSTLRNGGVVLVTTYLKSWQYEKKHLDWFDVKNNKLRVRFGKGYSDLTLTGGMPVVGIKFGRYESKATKSNLQEVAVGKPRPVPLWFVPLSSESHDEMRKVISILDRNPPPGYTGKMNFTADPFTDEIEVEGRNPFEIQRQITTYLQRNNLGESLRIGKIRPANLSEVTIGTNPQPGSWWFKVVTKKPDELRRLKMALEYFSEHDRKPLLAHFHPSSVGYDVCIETDDKLIAARYLRTMLDEQHLLGECTITAIAKPGVDELREFLGIGENQDMRAVANKLLSQRTGTSEADIGYQAFCKSVILNRDGKDLLRGVPEGVAAGANEARRDILTLAASIS